MHGWGKFENDKFENEWRGSELFIMGGWGREEMLKLDFLNVRWMDDLLYLLFII